MTWVCGVKSGVELTTPRTETIRRTWFRDPSSWRRVASALEGGQPRRRAACFEVEVVSEPAEDDLTVDVDRDVAAEYQQLAGADHVDVLASGRERIRKCEAERLHPILEFALGTGVRTRGTHTGDAAMLGRWRR